VPEPCSWTIVPTRYRRVAAQRARWNQILSEALWIHRVMLFNPRYREVGLTEEITYHRYSGWCDLALLIYGAFAENIGFRQVHAWWRLRGMFDAILRRKADWLEEPSSATRQETARLAL
jgi:hypothetical protein